MADVDIKRDLITIVEDIEGTITREMKKGNAETSQRTEEKDSSRCAEA